MARRNTKQVILDAAVEAYARYGYTATTCEDLAGAVGIRPSALYKHYENKREIYTAAVRQLADKAIAAARSKATSAVHFAQQPALLFVALHAAMPGARI